MRFKKGTPTCNHRCNGFSCTSSVSAREQLCFHLLVELRCCLLQPCLLLLLLLPLMPLLPRPPAAAAAQRPRRECMGRCCPRCYLTTSRLLRESSDFGNPRGVSLLVAFLLLAASGMNCLSDAHEGQSVIVQPTCCCARKRVQL